MAPGSRNAAITRCGPSETCPMGRTQTFFGEDTLAHLIDLFAIRSATSILISSAHPAIFIVRRIGAIFVACVNAKNFSSVGL